MFHEFSCIIVDDERDAIELLVARMNLLFKNARIAATYIKWADALEALKNENCDLLFMDISMPDKNGIEMLKLLPQLECEIIFVTAHEEYALDAFLFSTSGYILKPIDDAALTTAINKAIGRISYKRLARQTKGITQQINNKIGIPNNHGIDYVNVNEILYLESTNKCTRIVTAKTVYISSSNIGKFKEILSDSFFQIHRSYIVNLNYIVRYESSGDVIMTNKMEIPVSRNVKNEFLKIFNSSY